MYDETCRTSLSVFSQKKVSMQEAPDQKTAAPNQSEVTELCLCEARMVVLRPNQLYRFTVASGCPRCEAEAGITLHQPSTKRGVPASTALSANNIEVEDDALGNTHTKIRHPYAVQTVHTEQVRSVVLNAISEIAETRWWRVGKMPWMEPEIAAAIADRVASQLDRTPLNYRTPNEEPLVPVTTCPACDAPSSITFTREEERFPYGIAPHTVELTATVDRGRCSACTFEFYTFAEVRAARMVVRRTSCVNGELRAAERSDSGSSPPSQPPTSHPRPAD